MTAGEHYGAVMNLDFDYVHGRVATDAERAVDETLAGSSLILKGFAATDVLKVTPCSS